MQLEILMKNNHLIPEKYNYILVKKKSRTLRYET